MSSIKLHIFRGPNAGTESCDFRGPNAVGHNEGDEHRTVEEVKNASDGLIQTILMEGPAFNRAAAAIAAAEPTAFQGIASALGLGGNGPVSLRVGVWNPGQDEPTP